MHAKTASSATLIVCALAFSSIASQCKTPGGGTPASVLPVNPMCAILDVEYEVNPKVDLALVSERTDPTASHGFATFRGISGPKGNSTIGFTSDVYGINEAWLHVPGAPTVFRAQAHPAKGRNQTTFDQSAWSVTVQDATGAWLPPFAFGSANPGNEVDTPEAGGITVPQLMPVGDANPQMFACAGERSDDNRVRTTSLEEFVAPNPSRQIRGSQMFIQDLLSGDDRFVPNAPGPLIGPSNPPTPRVHGPGNPLTEGTVQCAMLQTGDNIGTRELHMIGVSQGHLYHALASRFATATRESGSTFQRFCDVSQWGDVGQVLGGNVGNIEAAAIVASRPNAVSVFFVAESNGRRKLFHAVRFSPAGNWRPVDDVLALSGFAATGVPAPFKVAAGMCPIVGTPPPAGINSEVVYAFWDAANTMTVGRVASTAPSYPRPIALAGLVTRSSDPTRQATIHSLDIFTRPFRDNGQ